MVRVLLAGADHEVAVEDVVLEGMSTGSVPRLVWNARFSKLG